MPATIAGPNDRAARTFGDCTNEEIEAAYLTSVRTVVGFAPTYRQHEAMDASHDAALTWLRWVSDGKYDRSTAKLSTLACTIALRTLWKRLRSIAIEGRRQVPITAENDPAQPTTGPARWADDDWREEALAGIEVGLESLNDIERAVIVGHYVYGHPYYSIAFEQNLKVGTVRQIAFRARVKMAGEPRLRALLLGQSKLSV